MQPKTTVPASIKPDQQVMTFFYKFWQGGMQQAVETASYKATHSIMQLQSKHWSITQVQVPKHTKPKLPKSVVRSYLTLNTIPELTKPKLLLLTKFTPKLSLQSCPPSAASTMLAIYYICVALCCSTHECCAVEYGVTCCAAQHTAIAALTFGT